MVEFLHKVLSKSLEVNRTITKLEDKETLNLVRKLAYLVLETNFKASVMLTYMLCLLMIVAISESVIAYSSFFTCHLRKETKNRCFLNLFAKQLS